MKQTVLEHGAEVAPGGTAARTVRAMVITNKKHARAARAMVFSKETQAILEDGKKVPHIVRVTRTVTARAATTRKHTVLQEGRRRGHSESES